MNKENIKILAIESSCDETAAAIIEGRKNGPVVLSNIVSSQADLHAKTGGVVPEVASRAHMEAIIPVVSLALLSSRQEISKSEFLISNQILNNKSQNGQINNKYQEAKALLGDVTHVAVTAGPGLIGSLLVGFNAAKTIAYSLDLPVIPVNHVEGHIYSAFGRETSNTKYQIPNNGFSFPLIAFTVSGGHTSMTLMKDHGIYETIGQTIDDAVGEAYDKVAQLLGLGYPGGPMIAKYAQELRDKFIISNSEYQNNCTNTKNPNAGGQVPGAALVFPRPMLNDGHNFSFSGLKTAVLREVRLRLSMREILTLNDKQEICFAFEEAVADVLCAKLERAIIEFRPKMVAFAGGVSANSYLRERLEDVASRSGVEFKVPPKTLCGDNAAMIGLAAFYHALRGDTKKWSEIKVDSNIEL